MSDEGVRGRRMLWRIRMAHTIAWTVFLSSIVAIPFVAVAGKLQVAVAESAGLGGSFHPRSKSSTMPLTGMAGRYTKDRSDNFDIFLPKWLARHNQLIFGSLFAIEELFLLWQWAILLHG